VPGHLSHHHRAESGAGLPQTRNADFASGFCGHLVQPVAVVLHGWRLVAGVRSVQDFGAGLGVTVISRPVCSLLTFLFSTFTAARVVFTRCSDSAKDRELDENSRLHPFRDTATPQARSLLPAQVRMLLIDWRLRACRAARQTEEYSRRSFCCLHPADAVLRLALVAGRQRFP
jgi:hypothetical protein